MTQAQPTPTRPAGTKSLTIETGEIAFLYLWHRHVKKGANAYLSQRQHPDFLQYQLPSIMPETAVENQPPHQ
ncbi:hypothetical protein N9M31_04175 [Alphaproteobacteria bacterium]|nr:hypothetical protein [Alphaproteobacteria bacterium]